MVQGRRLHRQPGQQPVDHRVTTSTAAPSLSSFWVPQFPYPDNGPAWTDYPGAANIAKTAYWVDYQGVRFIGLNTNVQSIPELMAKQTAWLEGLLKDNPNKWTVVTFHHPVYSNTGTRNNPVVRAQWGPLFEKYGVDLVLQGHDHSLRPGQPEVGPPVGDHAQRRLVRGVGRPAARCTSSTAA